MMEICFPHNPTEDDQIFEPNTQFMAEKNQNIPGFSKWYFKQFTSKRYESNYCYKIN